MIQDMTSTKKMKQRKTYEKYLTGFVLLLAFMLGSTGMVKAEIKQKGDCYYEEYATGIYIVGIRKGVKNPYIPDTINGKKVTDISLNSELEECEKDINTLKIPRYSNDVMIYKGESHELVRVKRYKVSTQNKKYCIREDCLYSKDEKELRNYPNGKKTKSFTVPEGTKDIYDEAFADSLVEKVTLPDSVEKIWCRAFENSRLKSIDLPSGLKEIGHVTFRGSSIQSIIIPQKVKRIEYSTFENCKELRRVTIPKKNCLKVMERDVFRNCTRLEEFVCQEPLVRLDITLDIGRNAFRNCTSLKRIELPNAVGRLKRACFYNCRKLKEIEISVNNAIISSYAFYNCKSLQKVTLKNGVFKIKRGAFQVCGKLKQVRVTSKSKKISIDKEAFARKGDQKKLTIIAPKGSYAYRYAKKYEKQGLKAKVLK